VFRSAAGTAAKDSRNKEALLVAIRFLDPLLRPTQDIIVGWPVVDVLIDIGFKRPTKPRGQIVPSFQKVPAIIDTAAHATFIDESLARGDAKRREESTTFGNTRVGAVYDALMEIEGLNDPITLEVGTMKIMTPTKRIPMLIGRDVLARYRLVFDPRRSDFRLER